MAIGSVVQKGEWIFAYDAKGAKLTSVLCNPKRGDGLKGYTSATFTVQMDGWNVTFDEKGHKLNSVLA